MGYFEVLEQIEQGCETNKRGVTAKQIAVNIPGSSVRSVQRNLTYMRKTDVIEKMVIYDYKNKKKEVLYSIKNKGSITSIADRSIGAFASIVKSINELFNKKGGEML